EPARPAHPRRPTGPPARPPPRSRRGRAAAHGVGAPLARRPSRAPGSSPVPGPEDQLEGGASLTRPIHPHPPPHLVYRTSHDGEPEARAVARFLGRVERLEHLVPVFRRDAGPRIGDVDQRSRLPRGKLDPRGPPPRR